MQTIVVDYIFEQLEENSLFFKGTDNELNISISASDYLDLKRLAKEMFKKSIIDAANITKEDRWYRADKYANCGEKYYDKYYGSKGSEIGSSLEWNGEVTNGNNVEEVPNVSNAKEINWGGVVQHIPNMCNCHQSNCHLINGKYICASCNKTLNVETQPITSSQTEISDEEIQAEAIKRSFKYRDSALFENIWEEAIEWYREQLKSRQ